MRIPMGLRKSATQEWTLGDFLTNFFQMKINVFLITRPLFISFEIFYRRKWNL